MMAAVLLCLSGAATAQDGVSPAQPAGTAVATQPTPAVSSYRINPGDELEIYVWGEERLQRVLRVLPDGTIAFPLVGQLRVAGYLPQQVEAMITERLGSQYRGEVPFVTVSVRNPSGLQFSVMGKVRSPGSFNPGRYITVLEALSLAGGPAEFANLDSVVVISRRDGQVTTSTVRLNSLFRAGANNRDVERANLVQIMPGDVIIVP
jgi:polysaccharide biosynthesis/export protein